VTLESERYWLSQYHQIISDFHTHLHSVHRFPHQGQFPVIKAFFADKKKIIQGQCGRSAGKTEEILYIAWRFALTNPGTETYIICPQIKQAKKIYWFPKRLQSYGPRKYVADIRESELRLVFTNGSSIVLDGCENYDSLRGIKPDLVIYDEFQHHTKDFDEEVMQPNLASGKVHLVVMGTPPKRHCYYVEFRENLLESIAAGDTTKYYVELPTEVNPTMDKTWLKAKREELIKRERYNVWLREYEGKLVFDSESAILVFLDDKKGGRHVKPRAQIEEAIKRDKSKLRYYAMFDPGTATCFAVLLLAYNPYTNFVYVLDEIYVTERRETAAGKIWAKAKEKMEAWNDDEEAWLCYYDEAATWFPNEIGQALIPTTKARYRREKLHEEGRPGESILNTLMEQELFWINEECEKFLWEATNYVTDEKGDYPKDHDHLMDGLFYFVMESHIALETSEDTTERDRLAELSRTRTPETLFRRKAARADLSECVEVDYYDKDDVGDIWMQ